MLVAQSKFVISSGARNLSSLPLAKAPVIPSEAEAPLAGAESMDPGFKPPDPGSTERRPMP